MARRGHLLNQEHSLWSLHNTDPGMAYMCCSCLLTSCELHCHFLVLNHLLLLFQFCDEVLLQLHLLVIKLLYRSLFLFDVVPLHLFGLQSRGSHWPTQLGLNSPLFSAHTRLISTVLEGGSIFSLSDLTKNVVQTVRYIIKDSSC